MPKIRRSYPLEPWHIVVGYLCCTLLASFAYAQVNQSGDDLARRSQIVIDNLKSGAYGPVTPPQVAAASQPGQLIPFLETRFAQIPDSDRKIDIAVALVRLGDKDDTYWNLIADLATPALKSEAPSPRSPEYRAWAKAHNVTPGSAEEQTLYNIWQKIIPLAFCGDPRSIPLLRKALQSPNTDTQAEAAEGLARDHDESSIPLIIAALNQASPTQARALAGSLKYFDNDPQAKAVVAKYFPVSDPLEALKRDTKGSDDSEVSLGYDVERMARAHEVQAIPLLEQVFAQRRNQTIGLEALLSKIPPPPHRTEDGYEANELNLRDELQIASVLIRLGVKDDLYWNYLAEQTRAALEINIPLPFRTDAQEGPNPPTNPQFLAWTRSRNLDQSTAYMYEVFVLPTPVTLLAVTDDHRGIPLLRRALQSANPMIQSFAAKGLASLQDKNSIPQIITACEKASPSNRLLIAESLAYFDDPQAQDAAEKYIPPPQLKTLREKIRSYGNDPFR